MNSWELSARVLLTWTEVCAPQRLTTTPQQLPQSVFPGTENSLACPAGPLPLLQNVVKKNGE